MNWKISKCDCSERNERNVHDQIFQNSYNNNDNDEDMTKKRSLQMKPEFVPSSSAIQIPPSFNSRIGGLSKEKSMFSVVDICWFYGLDRFKMKSLIMR